MNLLNHSEQPKHLQQLNVPILEDLEEVVSVNDQQCMNQADRDK